MRWPAAAIAVVKARALTGLASTSWTASALCAGSHGTSVASEAGKRLGQSRLSCEEARPAERGRLERDQAEAFVDGWIDRRPPHGVEPGLLGLADFSDRDDRSASSGRDSRNAVSSQSRMHRDWRVAPRRRGDRPVVANAELLEELECEQAVLVAKIGAEVEEVSVLCIGRQPSGRRSARPEGSSTPRWMTRAR